MKSRAHADDRIVTRHGIAAEQGDAMAPRQCERRTTWFAGEKDSRVPCHLAEQALQLPFLKMVEKKVRENNVGWTCAVQTIQYIAAQQRDRTIERLETIYHLRRQNRVAIHNHTFTLAPARRSQKPQRECSIATAEIQHALRPAD